MIRLSMARSPVARVSGVCVLTALMSGATSLAAQLPSSAPSPDSATVARTAYGEALRTRSLTDARGHLLRATTAWPAQPSYWVSLARVAARLGDSALVLRSIRTLTGMQIAAPLLADTTFSRWWTWPALSAEHATLRTLTGPAQEARRAATLTDSTVFAEGIDAHPRTEALYIASIRHRTVFEYAADGRIRDLGVHRDPRVGAIFGVRVAHDGRSLWLTTGSHAAMLDEAGQASAKFRLPSALLQVRISDGKVLGYWALPPDDIVHIAGDLAIASDGTVIVSDSEAACLHVLPRGGTLFTIRDPWFRSLQGVAPIPGTRTAVVADYAHGLFLVDFSEPARASKSASASASAVVSRVQRLQDAPGTTVLGLDGLLWHDGAVIAVQNGVTPARVVRITFDSARTRVDSVQVLDRQPSIATDPTIGTFWRGGFAYVANSQWSQYDANGQRIAGMPLAPTVILCVPLPASAATLTAASTARKGMRNVASTPPSTPPCTVSAAAAP